MRSIEIVRSYTDESCEEKSHQGLKTVKTSVRSKKNPSKRRQHVPASYKHIHSALQGTRVSVRKSKRNSVDDSKGAHNTLATFLTIFLLSRGAVAQVTNQIPHPMSTFNPSIQSALQPVLHMNSFETPQLPPLTLSRSQGLSNPPQLITLPPLSQSLASFGVAPPEFNPIVPQAISPQSQSPVQTVMHVIMPPGASPSALPMSGLSQLGPDYSMDPYQLGFMPHMDDPTYQLGLMKMMAGNQGMGSMGNPFAASMNPWMQAMMINNIAKAQQNSMKLGVFPFVNPMDAMFKYPVTHPLSPFYKPKKSKGSKRKCNCRSSKSRPKRSRKKNRSRKGISKK